MQLEFLEDAGWDGRHLLLTYGADPAGAAELRGAALALARGEIGDTVRVELLPGFVSVDGCSLLAVTGDEDLGVNRRSGSDRAFHCVLTGPAWDRVGDLLTPFTAAAPMGFQFLAEAGHRIDWVVSTSRAW